MRRATVVMGLGRSGRAAASLAVSKGERVVGVDLREDVDPIQGVELRLGPHDRRTFLDAERIIVSPGVPSTQPDLAAALAAGVPVIGELGYAASYLDTLPMVAITGTNGKSTVTWFTGQLLAAAGMRPFIGGNLGNPLSNAAVEGGYDALVVEVSSYQLEHEGQLRPQVGVILNLTADHLARHGTMEGYAAAKCRLFGHMRPSDLAILPAGDPLLRRHAGGHGTRAWLGDLPGVERRGDQVRIELPGVRGALDLGGLRVVGDHNRDNAATAALLAVALGVPLRTVEEAIPKLQPLAHRMEVIGVVDGVTWINDSKATNVDAARVGIHGVDGPAVVLLGGEAKGAGFGVLAPALARHRGVVCFGASGPAIAEEIAQAGQSSIRVSTLEDAVDAAAALAQPGDVVLLSPGCASFDAFQDFEHRGRVFRALVERRNP